MSRTGARTACARHARRDALTTCVSCGSALCAECIVPTQVGLKCSRCTGGQVAPSGRRQPRSPQGPRDRRPWVVVAASGVVLALVAGFGLSRDGGGDGGGATAGRRDDRSASVSDVPLRIIGAGGLRLGANLLLPGSTTSPVPAAVVIPGFGPTDRDGVATPGSAPDRLYRDLAEALGGAGVATVRYDKRGQRESRLPTGTPLRFEDMVEDARGVLDHLAERKGVDTRRLALVGHDEGGLVALRLAADDPRVRAVALVSTPGRRLAEVLADDLRATAPTPEEGEALAGQLQAVAGTLVATGALPAAEALPGPLRPVFPAGQEEYLRALFSLDPSADARRVHVPVLLVRGAKDTGVSVADEQALVSALEGGAQTLVGEGADHTLRMSGAVPMAGGDDGHGSPSHEVTGSGRSAVRDQLLLNRVSDWLAGRLGAGLAGELQISGREFFFAPGQLDVRPGTYRIVFTNTGSVEHQLAVHRLGEEDQVLAEIASVSPGGTRSLTVRLDGGTYEYACHLPGHHEAGMRGRIKVGS